MPATPPFLFKDAPVVYPSLPPVTFVHEPVISLSFPFGCGSSEAVVQIDRAPAMNREPETIPNLPGGGHSYDGCCLEYLAMGVAPADTAVWIGTGVRTWDIYVDGVARGSLDAFDGTEGPLAALVSPPGGGWGPGPYTVWLSGTYHDRPSFKDFWIDAGSVGVIAFAPSQPPDCACLFCPTILWDQPGWWDPWVGAHHAVTDLSGPVDRRGNYLSLAGPWGSDVLQQTISTDAGIELCHSAGVPDGTAFASSLIDFVETTLYDEITYTVETSHQSVAGCTTPRTGFPVFDPTHGFKVAGR